MSTVSSYGIHWTDDNVAFLEQGRNGINALGLKRRSPFNVILKNRRRHCNHQVNLATPIPDDRHWNFFQEIARDDLVNFMIPVPKRDGGIYVIEQDDQVVELISTLTRLSAPIHMPVLARWTINDPKDIVDEMGSTNLQPLVITDVEAKDSEMMADLCRGAIYTPRKLFIVAEKRFITPPQATRLDTMFRDPAKLDMNTFSKLPWESIGAQIVKKHMRGDRIFT